MKVILSFIILLSTAFAGKIVPNIKRNQIEPNSSGAAAALSKRNNVSAVYSKTAEKDETANSEDDTTSLSLLGNFSNENISTEFIINQSNYSFSPSNDDEGTLLFLNAGSKYQNIAIGANITHYGAESGSSFLNTELSANYLLKNNFILGAGVNRSYANGTDFDSYDYYLGAGLLEKDMAFDLVLNISPAKEKTTYSQPKTAEIKAQGTIFYGKFQISSLISSSVETSKQPSLFEQKIRDKHISTEVEYMLQATTFVGGSLGFGKTEFEDSKNSNNNYDVERFDIGLFGRFVYDQLQFIASYGLNKSKEKYNDSTPDQKNTDKTISLAASYFF